MRFRFDHDIRLEDNPVLAEAARRTGDLVCDYCGTDRELIGHLSPMLANRLGMARCRFGHETPGLESKSILQHRPGPEHNRHCHGA